MSQTGHCSRTYWTDVADDRLWSEGEVSARPLSRQLLGVKRTRFTRCEPYGS